LATRFQIPRDQWIHELSALSLEDGLIIQGAIPFCTLLGSWSHIQVSEQKIRLLLAQGSQEDSGKIVLELALPTEDLARYERRVNEAGGTMFSLIYESRTGDQMIEQGMILITNSLELALGTDYAVRPH